tara:strand:- start:24 stop:734 length:711 start_codon:yes stop_codon:yes gene_type:complete
MQPSKKIHQIFWNIQGKELDEIPLFVQSIKSIKEKNPDTKHILWSKADCEKLIKNKLPEYLDFYNEMKYDIQRLDFMRAAILYCEGGIYVDLDLICLKNIDKLFTYKFFIHSLRHIKPKLTEYVSNDFMGSKKGFRFWKILMDESKENYADKMKIEVYQTWKARFVLQTTGPRFVGRILRKVLPHYKPPYLVYMDTENSLQKEWQGKNLLQSKKDYYFENYISGSWLNTIKDGKES